MNRCYYRVVSKLNELIKINMSFHVVILQRDTKGWYSRKCSIIHRTLLLVSSAEEQDATEMSERKKNHLQYLQINWHISFKTKSFSHVINHKNISTILKCQGQSMPWSYDSWIYNYLCNRCISPLMLWIQLPPKARCTTLCDKVSDLRQVDCFLRVLRFPPPIILLKVTLNTIKQIYNCVIIT